MKFRSCDWEIILGYMGDMVGVTGRLWWGMYLAKPNTFTMFLTNERGRQERQRQRNWDDGSRAMWGRRPGWAQLETALNFRAFLKALSNH